MHLYTGLHDEPVWSQTIRRHDYRSGFSGMIFFTHQIMHQKSRTVETPTSSGFIFLKASIRARQSLVNLIIFF